MTRRRIKIFFDGGCRPNPGRIEVAVVVRGVTHLYENLGCGSSSDAEWLALVSAVKLTNSLGLADVELLGDAKDVIGRASAILNNGRAGEGYPAAFLAAAAEASPTRIRVRWVKREQNLAGIALSARHSR